jgi:uncharacterized oligopeptide transporter (OPT) family protein
MMQHGAKGGPVNRPGIRRYVEASISSVVFGLLLGAIMNAAITYAGLKIGFTIGGSAIAAVLGFGVLRGILRRGTILECNLTQTVASSVNTTNAGVIFTVPVLLLLGYRLSFSDTSFWMITLACSVGAVLGVAFIVPLRKQMIEIDRLRFPSPTAVGAILKSPGAGIKKSIVLAAGILVAIVIYLPSGLPSIKSPAALSDLDSLVERERITPAQATLTRTIAGWIDAKAAPEAVIARGRLVEQLHDVRVSTTLSPEDKAKQEEALKAQIKAVAGAEGYSDALCQAAYLASTGAQPWDSLRTARTGWAMKPLPGYQDLGLRLSDKGATAPLDRRIDRDQNGRADHFVTDSVFDIGRLLGLPDEAQLALAIAPFALGAGYLTGRAGLMVLAGGFLAYLVLNPLAFRMGWLPQTVRADQVASYAMGAYNRPLGVGLLLGGALLGVVASLPSIREALRSIARAGKTTTGGRDELGLKTLVIVVMTCMALLLVAAEFVGQPTASTGALSWMNPWVAKAVIVLVAGAWIWFAGIIIAQCTGMTDWSPVSGMALLTVVLVLLLAGTSDVISAVLLGAALCAAITCAADMMGDLKTGHIVGARPRTQQTWELVSAGIGPVITMATLVLIASVNLEQTGIAIGPGTPTVAPQAQALKAVVDGVQGQEMPYAQYGFGALLGALLGIAAFPSLGVLVGLSMYLPFMYILTYGLGCVANMVLGKIKGRSWAEEWGVPFCAGLIVGDACLALIINAIVLIRG